MGNTKKSKYKFKVYLNRHKKGAHTFNSTNIYIYIY